MSQTRADVGFPEVTIVVVPRERFSVARRSLETLYRETERPFRLVYVDGGSPPQLSRYLEAEARTRGFELIRTDRYLSPNEARNLGLARAIGRYVVFVDNDLLVTRGWLSALVRCAEETGADLVGPLYGFGEPENGWIHMAGGKTRIEEKNGSRRLREEHRFPGRRIIEVEADLRRQKVELVEFHCMLARLDELRALGPLDEELLSVCEHSDLCLSVAARGRGIWFEPTARVTYLAPSLLDRSDRAFFRLRWSDRWTRRTVERFRRKWRLSDDDPFLVNTLIWVRNHRRPPLWSGVLGRPIARVAVRAVRVAERLGRRARFRSSPAAVDQGRSL